MSMFAAGQREYKTLDVGQKISRFGFFCLLSQDASKAYPCHGKEQASLLLAIAMSDLRNNSWLAVPSACPRPQRTAGVEEFHQKVKGIVGKNTNSFQVA